MPAAVSSRHRELGLTDHEYELIVEKLGREPNDVELAMFSLMWSEHCGYKHSRKLLRKLPTDGPAVVPLGDLDLGGHRVPLLAVRSYVTVRLPTSTTILASITVGTFWLF